MGPRRALPLLVCCLLLLGTGVTIGAASSGYDISVSSSIDVPDQTYSILGNTFEITSIGRVDPGQSIDVATSGPSGESYILYLYDRGGNRMEFRRMSGDDSASFSTSGLTPGTYVVVIRADGDYQAIQPVVVRGYDAEQSVSSSAGTGDTIEVTVQLDAQSGAPPVDAVEVALADDAPIARVEATPEGSGTYTASITLPDEPGTYEVYSAVLGSATIAGTGEPEILDLTRPSTVSVEADSGGDEADGDGGNETAPDDGTDDPADGEDGNVTDGDDGDTDPDDGTSDGDSEDGSSSDDDGPDDSDDGADDNVSDGDSDDPTRDNQTDTGDSGNVTAPDDDGNVTDGTGNVTDPENVTDPDGADNVTSPDDGGTVSDGTGNVTDPGNESDAGNGTTAPDDGVDGPENDTAGQGEEWRERVDERVLARLDNNDTAPIAARGSGEALDRIRDTLVAHGAEHVLVLPELDAVTAQANLPAVRATANVSGVQRIDYRDAAGVSGGPRANATVTITAQLETPIVNASEAAILTASLENPAGVARDVIVTLSVDGAVVDAQEVPVAANETRNERFRFVVDEPGEYDIAISDVPAGTLTVQNATSSASFIDNASMDPSPGFGLAGTLLGLVFLALRYRRRRDP